MTTLALSVGFVLLVGFFIVLFRALALARSRRLPAGEAKRLMALFDQAAAHADPHRRVLDTEKAVDTALFKLGYTGSFADKLKKVGPRFPHLNAVWSAHKLRNQIAHDMHVTVSEREAQSAVQAFRRALESLS